MNKNITLEKLNAFITLLALFFILIPSFASVWIQFIPDDNFITSIRNLSYIYAVILCLMSGYMVYKMDGLKLGAIPAGKKVVLFLFTPPLTIWLFVSMFQNGLPLTLHQVNNYMGEKQFVVAHKSRQFNDHKCHGGLYLKHKSQSITRICGLKKSDWDSVQSGDKITIYGRISRYGMSFNKLVTSKANRRPL